jgi:hypothetical protein
MTSTGVGVGFLLGLLLATSPAAASRPWLAASAPLEGHMQRGFGSSQSTNWSGYAAYGAPFASVRGDWVQPQASCESPRQHHYALAAFWVGLDGYENNTVEQTGTEADCEGPAPVYYAWWELYPKAPAVIEQPVQPGDQMHAEVSQDELLLEDLTAGWTMRQSFLPGSLAFSSAEWIAEAPAKNTLTDFGSVHFSSAFASDEALADGAIESKAWSDDAITLVGGSHAHPTVVATPGALEEEARAFTIEASTTGVARGHPHH